MSALLRRRSILSTLLHSHLRRPFSRLSLADPTFAVFGANTGVGKTLVSTGLALSLIPSHVPLLYLKTLQTGFPADSDAAFLASRVPPQFSVSNSTVFTSPAVSGLSQEMEEVDFDVDVACRTLYAWSEPVSPHLAVEREGLRVGDEELRREVGKCLEEMGKGRWSLVETAGGVASPGPSGTLQCDLYRPFRFPAILVGDGRLGGISSTISSYETLVLRGYDVTAVILEDHGLFNEAPILSYLKKSVPVLVMPTIPKDPENDLTEWFCETSTVFDALRDALFRFHDRRLQRLKKMQEKSKDRLWWPFTQHDLVPQESVTVIDSRCGENFSVFKAINNDEVLVPQYDACASWWTQGPNSSMQIELARDMGYSAARYGHVMFPENVYEPALDTAERLLEGVGKGWASRVYYSDNGSTAIEIALKMAFRKFCLDHEITVNCSQEAPNERIAELKVLALAGSYHGDTLGAMEAQAPSAYTSFLQQPWYSGRGLFLDPPTVFKSRGDWKLSLPNSWQSSDTKSEHRCFLCLSEIFCSTRDVSAVARTYSSYIRQKLSEFSASNISQHIGALIIEPVIQGAGGMHMIDPLFQRILVKECQTRKIPVIFDEVFTGFWRLGRESAAELLGCSPDVACYAKLLTGGMVPLAATLTSEPIFEAFRGDTKLKALLHGHSYTAHAIGCTAALKSIQWFKNPSTNHNLDPETMKLNELWDDDLVNQLSFLPNVQRVVSLGTLCSIELKAEGCDSGYASLCATSLVRQLREDGIYVRPLGNVIYLLSGPCTSKDSCTLQLRKVYGRIKSLGSSNEQEHPPSTKACGVPQSVAA